MIKQNQNSTMFFKKTLLYIIIFSVLSFLIKFLTIKNFTNQIPKSQNDYNLELSRGLSINYSSGMINTSIILVILFLVVMLIVFKKNKLKKFVIYSLITTIVFFIIEWNLLFNYFMLTINPQ
jgi:NADH:ubiquinone oxidoreductase subunit 4 (subunit M)